MPERLPVLALHGWLGRGEDWAPVAGMLGRPLIAPDLPGHGDTAAVDAVAQGGGPPAGGSFDIDHAAAVALGALDAAGARRAVVAGYSMGGRVALHLALLHPDRVGGLVLVSASAGLPTAAERAARRVEDAGRARRLLDDPDGFLRDWYDAALFDPLPPASRARLAADRIDHARPAGWARALRGLSVGAQPWHGDRLREIGVPALALAGAADAKYAGLARLMAEAGGFECRLVPDAGHALLVERPDAVAGAIEEVLGRARDHLAASSRSLDFG